MAFSEGKFLELIDQFYEAACSPGNWRDVLQEAAGALSAEGVNLLTGPDCPLAPVCSPALEEMRCTGDKEGWWKDNPRLIRGMAAIHNPKDIITDATLFSKEELDRLPFHADFLARFELRWFAGMLLVPEGRTKVALSVDRRRDQDPFSSGELKTLRKLLPHLQRTGRLALLVAEARGVGTLDALEMMSCAGVLLSATGRVLRCNAKAEELFGRGLRFRDGQISTEHVSANASLRRLIECVASPAAAHELLHCEAVAVPRPQGSPLIVRGIRLVGVDWGLFQRAQAVLIISEAENQNVQAGPVLQKAFGLSPAETNLAVALSVGIGMKEYCEERRIAVGTARVHLRSIFSKTSTHRQGELIALIHQITTNVSR